MYAISTVHIKLLHASSVFTHPSRTRPEYVLTLLLDSASHLRSKLSHECICLLDEFEDSLVLGFLEHLDVTLGLHVCTNLRAIAYSSNGTFFIMLLQQTNPFLLLPTV